MAQSVWNYPTRILFGPGRIAGLAAGARGLGMHHPLLVTDPGLASHPMVMDAVENAAAAHLPIGIFSRIDLDPTDANIADGVAAFLAGGHDGVIAFGGGSALDAGKAIALMSGQKRPLWDFEDREDWWTRVDPAGIAPILAVPTTAGTGSEVGRASIITDTRALTKKIIFHPKMLPGLVISDPELTLGLPARLTAATGMDALAHCLEAFCAPGFHPMADGIAAEGLRLIHDFLPRAVKDGGDVEARGAMLAAASMGAAAFQKGLGAVHALAHPLGPMTKTHHGLLNGVLMPYVLAFNRDAIAPRMGRLAGWLGLGDGGFDAVQAWLLALRAEIGIPHSLAELGMKAGIADDLATKALDDPSCGGNPVKLDHGALKALYLDALEGRLAA